MELTASDLLRRIGIKMRQQGDDFTKGYGLSVREGNTIGYIEANEERGVIQRELAEISGMRAASITALVQGLEKNGYIERRSDPNDDRRKTLHVTAKAKAITEAFDKLVEHAEEGLLAPLTKKEREQFIGYLKRIDEAL